MATSATPIKQSTSRPIKRKASGWQEKPVSVVPADVRSALRAAMALEGVSPSQYDDYLWIIAQESTGKVGAKNAHSSARGLFQLLSGQYSLNPNGEESFGNAKEECQGGIRYVKGRYGSARKAREFWQKHHWY